MSAVLDLFDQATEDPAPPAPITEEQWIRILDGKPFRILVKPEQIDWASRRAVRCIGCEHAGDSGGAPWRAYCLVHRVMVSNAFSKLCREYARA